MRMRLLSKLADTRKKLAETIAMLNASQSTELHITSIPRLIAFHGSFAATARATGWNERAIAKYHDDVDMIRHCVVNGRLMTSRRPNRYAGV